MEELKMYIQRVFLSKVTELELFYKTELEKLLVRSRGKLITDISQKKL